MDTGSNLPVTLEMANELRILILEDEAAAADLLEWELRRSKIPFTARRAATKEDYVRGLEEFAPDIILSDYTLPDFDGMEALSRLERGSPMCRSSLLPARLTRRRPSSA